MPEAPRGGRLLHSVWSVSLCLAGVLVDDIRGDGLLLLLLPQEEDALVDEDVLLLGLDHGQPMGSHLRHHPQDVHELVLPDVLHEAVQGDEGPGSAHAGAGTDTETRRSLTAGSALFIHL